MITFQEVTKIYNAQKGDDTDMVALMEVSFEIKPKEFVVLIGESGAGKSTILKLLHCQEQPTSGKIFVDGVDASTITKHDIPQLRRKVGYIFQDFKLLPKKTVVQNIAFALEIIGEPSKRIRRILPKVIKMVGLEGKEYSLPSELSGGEMQRTAIARALVYQPKILLADEPTGNLDSVNTWKVIDLLLKINSLGTTVVLATHDQAVVEKIKQRTIALQDGKIVADQTEDSHD